METVVQRTSLYYLSYFRLSRTASLTAKEFRASLDTHSLAQGCSDARSSVAMETPSVAKLLSSESSLCLLIMVLN